MLSVLISVFAFVVAMSVLVAVHEFGHFWVARRFGIKVLRFSIGFGRPLYRWFDKLGTEYVISAIPLGGYVSLLGEQAETVPPLERHAAFVHKSVWVRMLVVLAGPLFNLLFSVLVYWVIFLLGVTVLIPILGNVPEDSVAGLAGLKKGQEIIAVEGKRTRSWEDVSLQLLTQMGEDKTISVTVQQEATAPLQEKIIDLGSLSTLVAGSNWMESLGLVPLDLVPPRIGKIIKHAPAFDAGLQEQDLIVEAEGEPMSSRSQFIHYIQSNPLIPIKLKILRANQFLTLSIVPKLKVSESGKNLGFIGAEFPALKTFPTQGVRTERWGALGSLKKALDQTFEYSVLTLGFLKKMVLGTVSARHINGPIVMAKYAGESITIGLKAFLDFLAKMSISIGVLNLLPIPILDGGRFLYCLYEALLGRSVSGSSQVIAGWIGAGILVVAMILAFYNDMTYFFR